MRTETWAQAAALILFLSMAPACEKSGISSTHAEIASTQRVIARVNDEAVYENEFDQFVELTEGELSDDPQFVPRRELFREYLTRKLLLQEAKKSGTKVDNARVETYVRQWTARDVEESQDFSQHVRDFLTVQKFMSEQIRPEVEVTLSEVLGYYEKNSDQFVLEDQAHVLEILTRERAEAARIRRELEDADIRDFKERARRDSIGVTAAMGGDLGFFQRGDLPEDFEKVIFSMKPGQLSEPFESVHGFHVFLIEEWIPRHPQKFFEVHDQIFEMLVAEKERAATRKVLNEMLKAASIEIYDASFRQILEEDSFEEYKVLD